MFRRRAALVQPVALEMDVAPAKEWFKWPALNDRVEIVYEDGKTVITEAFKVEWNNPAIRFIRIL